MECLFCKIVKEEIPAKIAYSDEQVIAFEDINPQAKYHFLIIPRKHIATINDISEEDNPLIGHMINTAKTLAKKCNIADDGYRVVMNCNHSAGQTVFHIHLHLLGGRQLSWPPG